MGGGFADGEVALFVAEGGEAGLEVQREWVVDLAADLLVGEILAECVAAWGTDDVLVEDVAGAWVGDGKDDAFADVGCGELCCMEELVVAGGVVAALLVPPGKVAEFDLEDGGLDGVEAGVPADLVVIVAAAHAVSAEDAGVVVDCGGGCGDQAGVADGAEIFCGVEAEGCGVAEGSGGDAVPGGSEGLGSVFDEDEGVVVFQ